MKTALLATALAGAFSMAAQAAEPTDISVVLSHANFAVEGAWLFRR
jgi:hypothetical protein